MSEPATIREEQRTGRPFPWVCPKCRKKEVRPATIPYHAKSLYNGRHVEVDISELVVPRCAHCGELVFNYTADEQIVKAVEEHAKLSNAEQSQPAFASALETRDN